MERAGACFVRGMFRIMAVGVFLVGLTVCYKAVGWGIQDWDFDRQARYFEYYGRYNYGGIASAIFDFGMAAIALALTSLAAFALWVFEPFDN